MATKKITQSTIKSLIKEGAATDLDTLKKQPKREELSLIGISYGTYGMNGALFVNKKGKMYAIKSRSSLLFYYV